MYLKESTKHDNLSLILTISTSLFVLVFSIFILYQQNYFNGNLSLANWGIVFLFIVFFTTWGLHPSGYILNDTSIEIVRPFKSIVIKKEEIESIKSITKNEVGTGMRLFGSGGFLGYFGLYSSNTIGRHYKYITHTNLMLVITLKNQRKYVISPTTIEFVEGAIKLAST